MEKIGAYSLKLNKLSFVLIGASLFLMSSPVFASELDQQIKQNQSQLTQTHQQEQDFMKQIQDFINQMNDNQAQEERFKKAVVKEELAYQEVKDKIASLNKEYKKLSKQEDESLTAKQLEKKTNKLIDLKDEVRLLEREAEKYPNLIKNFQSSVDYYQQQRVICEANQAILTAKLKDVTNKSSQLQHALKDLQAKKAAEDQEKARQAAKEAEAKVTGFASPLETPLVVSSGFGSREDPNGKSGTQHDGIDLPGSLNQKVMVARAGQVVTTGSHPSAGNFIIVKHDNGYYSYYLHLNEILVKAGETVLLGQTIGKMGTTGNSTGVHLHFGLAKTPNWQEFVDPAYALGLKK